MIAHFFLNVCRFFRSLLAVSSVIAFLFLQFGCTQKGQIEERLSASLNNDPTKPIHINGTNASSIVLSGICDTEGALITISGSGTGTAICQDGQWSATVDASHAPDGPVEFIATLTMSDGTTTSVKMSGTKKTTSPSVAITTNPATVITSANASAFTFAGTCSENALPVVISSGSFSDTTTCTAGNWSKVFNFSTLAEGTNSISAKQTDAVGNFTTAFQNQFKDTLPPANASASLSGTPTGISGTTNLNVTVSGAADATHYMYKVGEFASTDCNSQTGYASETTLATPITANISALADGNVKLCVITRDTYGNYQTAANSVSATWTKDAIAPTVSSISSPAPAVGKSSTNFVYTITFSEDVTVNTTSTNVTLGGTTAGCTKTVAQGLSNTATVTISNCSGTGNINIASVVAGTGVDAGGNNSVLYATASSDAAVDNTAPTVTGISAASPSSGNSSTSFVYTVTFSEDVTVNTTSTNVTLGGTTAGCTKTVAQGATNTAIVTISNCSGTGNVNIASVVVGTGVDAGGNNSVLYSTASGNAAVDNTAPTVSGISAASPAVGKSTTDFSYTVTFSENVTVNTASTNVTLGGTATAGCTTTVAQGAANTAIVTISNCSGDGTVNIASVVAGTGADAVGNNSVLYSTASGNATVDNTAPTVSGISAPSPSSGGASVNFVFTVTYSENLTVVTNSSNVTLGGTATGGCTKTIAQGAANTATITVSNCSGTGTMNIASLASGTGTDAAGNSAASYSTASSDATVLQQSDPSSLTLTHTARNRSFTFSWSAGSGNGGAGNCKLQYVGVAGAWTDFPSAATHNCDAAKSTTTEYFPASSNWTNAWNATGVTVRILRINDQVVMGTFSTKATCPSAAGGSASATPNVDENCNGQWDDGTGNWAHYFTYGYCTQTQRNLCLGDSIGAGCAPVTDWNQLWSFSACSNPGRIIRYTTAGDNTCSDVGEYDFICSGTYY